MPKMPVPITKRGSVSQQIVGGSKLRQKTPVEIGIAEVKHDREQCDHERHGATSSATERKDEGAMEVVDLPQHGEYPQHRVPSSTHEK